MAKAVEVAWNLTPFRSDEFIEQLQPIAARVINYGATGYLVVRQTDDELVVKQYSWIEDPADWDRYWNSELLQKFRAETIGLYAVPVLYTWQHVEAFHMLPDAAPEAADDAEAVEA